MFRVLESHRVNFAIDRDLRASFRRELLELPIEVGALALVRLRTARAEPTLGAVVLVHGFGMNRHTWHLGTRSFAGYLADQGFDVFVLELRGVGRSRELGSPIARHPEEYVEIDLPAAVRAASLRSGHDRVFVIGHSLGGLIAYGAMSLLERELHGVLTLSGVFTFAGESAILRALSLLARLLTVPGRRWRGAPFAVRFFGRKLGEFVAVSDSQLFRRVMPAQAWYPQGIERELLLEQIRVGWDISSLGVLDAILRLGRRGELVGGDGGNLLDSMAAIDLPLLVVAAEHDSLVPPVDARVAYDRSQSTDKELVILGPGTGQARFGHLDLILGRFAPSQVWPICGEWLQKRLGGDH